MTLGQKISYGAKAVAALCVALVSLFTAVLATMPADVPDALKNAAVWIQAALAFLTVAAVWLTTNGPKIGAVVDMIDEAQEAVRGRHQK